jgi:hypothetical protein
MMAGCAHAVIGPTDFILGFVVTEVISLLSEIIKEDMHMILKAAVSSGKRLWSCVKSSTMRLIAFSEALLPFRQSLLMSLCNSSEKVLRFLPNKSINLTVKKLRCPLFCYLNR